MPNKVRKILIAFALAFAILGCDEPTMVDGKPNLEVGKRYAEYGEIKYIMFDGHEYVLMVDGHRGGITHSPKCECLNQKTNKEK